MTVNLIANSLSPYQPTQAGQRFIEDLNLMIRAKYPLLYIVAAEEEPVMRILQQVALQAVPQRRLLQWNIVRGWDDHGTNRNSVMGALDRIRKQEEAEPTIFVLKDLHYILRSPHISQNAPVIRELKNLAQELKQSRHTLILTSHTLEVPSEISEDMTVMDFPLP
ncbi:MAG: AAA family ATPase, partial [Kamptonema sp. SIO4C4]|nr:AAA family ATPase [Kamptonema sp. SIO4C4]